MAVILAAKRSAVVPRGGAFARLEVEDLAAPVVRALLDAAGMSGDAVDELICANALGAGGNPARIVALAAGLPQQVAGLSLDIGDYLVSNGTGWEQIDNVEVSVSGTANEIVVSGNRADGFVISLAWEFKTRLSDVEAAVSNIGTTQQFSDALSAAFAAGV